METERDKGEIKRYIKEEYRLEIKRISVESESLDKQSSDLAVSKIHLSL